MKNYSTQNYTNYSEFVNELNTDLNTELKSFTVQKGNQVGTVTEVRVAETTADIYLKVEYPERTCTLSLKTILDKNLPYVFDDEVKSVLIKYLEPVTTAINKMEAEAAEKRRLEAEILRKKMEEEQQRKKEEADRIKFENRRKSALSKLDQLQPEDTSSLFDSPMTHYQVLGWLAKHTKSIKASMPDYMESWFIKNFGQDADRYVVDSKKKTVNGHPMQWSLSCKISFDTEVSGILEQKVTTNKKAIDNVSFVWDLIDNYGFTFGKKQDVEKILTEIPTQYVEDFQRGYAM
jgi:hypothetical protein